MLFVASPCHLCAAICTYFSPSYPAFSCCPSGRAVWAGASVLTLALLRVLRWVSFQASHRYPLVPPPFFPPRCWCCRKRDAQAKDLREVRKGLEARVKSAAEYHNLPSPETLKAEAPALYKTRRFWRYFSPKRRRKMEWGEVSAVWGPRSASVAIVVGGVVDGGLSMGRFSLLSLVKKLYLEIVMSGRFLLYIGVVFLAKRRSERSERSVFGNKYYGHIYLFL